MGKITPKAKVAMDYSTKAYEKLRKSFVIFICTFDFFRKGLPVYTFTNRCREMPELELSDGTVKVFKFMFPCTAIRVSIMTESLSWKDA